MAALASSPACDVVIAADNAMFSIAEVRWGLTAAIIIPQLNDAIGVRQVRRYALTGERFGAEEARRIGLVHEVVPLAELEAAGARIVGHLLENGPAAIAETKALALASSFGDLADEGAFAQLIEAHSAKRQSGEAAEGLASFAGEARGAMAAGGLVQLLEECARRGTTSGVLKPFGEPAMDWTQAERALRRGGSDRAKVPRASLRSAVPTAWPSARGRAPDWLAANSSA